MTEIEIKVPSNFPLSLVYYILSYAQRPQPQKLLVDITYYYHSKKLIHQHYKDIWEEWAVHPNEYLENLENDIYRYANRNVPTMYGYTPAFYRIFLRLPFINPIKRPLFFGKSLLDNSDYTYKVYKYIRNIDFRNDAPNVLKFKINILWGLFTIREREKFIDLMIQ